MRLLIQCEKRRGGVSLGQLQHLPGNLPLVDQTDVLLFRKRHVLTLCNNRDALRLLVNRRVTDESPVIELTVCPQKRDNSQQTAQPAAPQH